MKHCFLLFVFCLFVFSAETKDINFKKGEVYYSQKKFSVAKAYLKKAVLASPDNDLAYFYLANIYLVDKNYSLANKNFMKAIEIKGRASYYYNFASLKHLQGLDEVAEQLYLKALTADPQKYKAHEQLAQIYIKTLFYEKAVFHLRKVLAIFPSHPNKEKILQIIDFLQQNKDVALEKREKKHNNISAQLDDEDYFPDLEVDLTKVGSEKEIESKNEESITDVKLDLDVLE